MDFVYSGQCHHTVKAIHRRLIFQQQECLGATVHPADKLPHLFYRLPHRQHDHIRTGGDHPVDLIFFDPGCTGLTRTSSSA